MSLEHATGNVLQALLNGIMPSQDMTAELERELKAHRENRLTAEESPSVFVTLKSMLEHRTDAANDLGSLLKVIERMERMHPGCNFEPALIYIARISKGLDQIEAASGVAPAPKPKTHCLDCFDTGTIRYGAGAGTREMDCPYCGKEAQA